MSTRSISVKLACAALVIAALGFVVSRPLVTTHAQNQATVTTDRNKYGEGETMLLSGTGFTANAAVYIDVLRPDHITDYLSTIADGGGSFQTAYTPTAPAPLGRYKITARDGTNSAKTAATEADASFSLEQCQQNTNAGLGFCNWVGGNLGQNFSLIYEGMATEQRLLITGIIGSGEHTLMVGIQATKGGIHTYDWLVSDAQASGTIGTSTENSEKASALAGITLVLNRCDDLQATDQAACNALVNGATTTNTVDIDVPDDPYVSQDGLTQTKITNYETGTPSSTCKFCGFGNRTVRLYTNSTVSAPSMTLVHMDGKTSGSPLVGNDDTGDSFIWYTIKWTGSSTSAMLVAGADVAYGGNGTGRSWGAHTGATDIHGAPYHFYLISFDGDGGSLDNQMSANSVFTLPTRLTLHKVVTNDNGGSAVATDWTLSASGPTPISGTDGSANVTAKTVTPGTYNLSESGGPASGYTNGTTYSCVLNGAAPVPTNSITLDEGDTAVCTITNDDQAAHLIVIKHVINDDGGSAVASDYTETIAGVTAVGGQAVTGTEAPGVNKTLSTVGAYTVTESAHPGYAVSYSADCNATIALGETKTCTVTNDDIAAHLIVIKHVINDSGGNAVASAFTETIAGVTAVGGQAVTGTEAPGVNKTLSTVGAYTVTEGTHVGYTVSYSADCNATIALGETKTCTVTNDDDAAKLIIIKNVINNNGGSAAASAFSGTIGGTATWDTGTSWTGTVDPGLTKNMTAAGTYTVTETAATGYTTTYSAGCTGSIALGETKTCTVTNDDQAAKLIIIKNVINNNGGTAAASAFSGNISGTATWDTGTSWTGTVDPGLTKNMTAAGTYTVTETAATGYTTTYSAGCTGSIALGQTKTCTVTNDDQPASLTLVKSVSNTHGGTASAANFALSAGTAMVNVASGTTNANVSAGTYALGETALAGGNGYTLLTLGCLGFTNGGGLSNGQVTLKLGENVTCTFTNGDVGGTIIVKKITKPVNTGSFGFTTTGTGYNTFTLPGGGQNSQTLNAGSYTVKELVPLSGWILTGIGGDPSGVYNCSVTGSGGSTGVGDLNTQTATINLKNGDTVTCTFENTGTGTGATRTQGFWATHTPLANIAWFGGTAFGHTFLGVPDKVICPGSPGRTIDNLGQLMGGFWSGISSTSTNKKRSSIDQARMQLLQQLLAAELNSVAFGSTPSVGSIAAWESAYCTGNASALQTAQQQAGSFNSQGDNSTFTPGTSADSKYARSIANLLFWDVLP